MDVVEVADATKAEEEEFGNGPPQFSKDPFVSQLDDYRLPSIIHKNIKEMLLDSIIKINTTRVDKFFTNLESGIIKKEWFNEGDNEIELFIHLVDFDKPESMYKLNAEGKLKRVKHIKEVATEFFKLGEWKRACKFYQKINGYYNFGDISNNQAHEDETTDHYKQIHHELAAIKISCFMNVCVCKAKQEEWQSIVDITDQVVEFAPENLKCWYWRARGLMNLEEYTEAIEAYKKCLEIDIEHGPSRKEMARCKKGREQQKAKSTEVFGKMFS